MNDSQGRNVSPIIKGGCAPRRMKPGGKEEKGKENKKGGVWGSREQERFFLFLYWLHWGEISSRFIKTSLFGSFGCVGRTSADEEQRRGEIKEQSLTPRKDFHLCLGDGADPSRRSSHTNYFIKLCSLYGDGERALQAPTSLYPFCNKRPEPLPEEPTEFSAPKTTLYCFPPGKGFEVLLLFLHRQN